MVRHEGVCVWRFGVVCLSTGGFAPGFGMDHMGLDWACIPRGTRTVISGLETAEKATSIGLFCRIYVVPCTCTSGH